MRRNDQSCAGPMRVNGRKKRDVDVERESIVPKGYKECIG